MEPELVEKKILKKLLKRSLINNSSILTTCNKYFTDVIILIKHNWFIVLILTVIIILFVHLYFEKIKKDKVNKNKDKENDNMDNTDKMIPKSSYEANYYTMLPRVTQSPDVVPYMYQS